MVFITVIIVLIILFILSGLKVVKEYERGVRFTLGKFTGMMQPGLRVVVPIFQTWQRVDIRVRVADVPDQESITKDNITVGINAVIYYKVTDAKKAVIEVERFNYAISQLAQTTMRNIIGEVELDELLSNRDEISERIREIVDKATDPWGIKVSSVELKDITLAPDMKRVIGKQAEAEREKRAVIIKAEGEVIASNNISKAANTLAKSSGALHLRTLQTLNDLSSDKSNTVILGVPLEVLRAFENIADSKKKKK